MQPTYLVFGGVNGAGKSTFFHTGFWRTDDLPTCLPRVNSGEIVICHGGDPRSDADQIKAGRTALALIGRYFESGTSFNQETTLTGHTAVRNIRRARAAGYRVVLYYIGVATPEDALHRIAHRVAVGGHPIDEQTVRRRYRASLRNLSHALPLCHEAVLLDNTVEFVAIARWTNGVLSWVGNLAKHGTWLTSAIRDDTLWKA